MTHDAPNQTLNDPWSEAEPEPKSGATAQIRIFKISFTENSEL